ncbi:Peroxidase 2 [Carex littledalei]|uniref:Peroxidase 2 n=1 Tax=Carex littledalei TaxID=544730 RepID=A0A833VRQ4_9POAL|nr:Peroxidase 2 [Carex littledalei]
MPISTGQCCLSGLCNAMYFRNVTSHKTLFSSDMSLMPKSNSSDMVNRLGRPRDPIHPLFEKKFVDTMVKMGNIEVHTGKKGEMRRSCTEPTRNYPTTKSPTLIPRS